MSRRSLLQSVVVLVLGMTAGLATACFGPWRRHERREERRDDRYDRRDERQDDRRERWD